MEAEDISEKPEGNLLDEQILAEDGEGLGPEELLSKERSSIFETRINFGVALRKLGNSYFNSKDMDAALRAYRRALHHLDFDEAQIEFELMDQHRVQLFDAKVPVLLNLAQTLMRTAGGVKAKEEERNAVNKEGAEQEQLVAVAVDKNNQTNNNNAGDDQEQQKDQLATSNGEESGVDVNLNDNIGAKDKESEAFSSETPHQEALRYLNEAVKLREPPPGEGAAAAAAAAAAGAGGGDGGAAGAAARAKALFLRGRVRTALQDYDRAGKDLLDAQKINPNDRAISTAIKQLKILEASHRKKQKKIWGGKFVSTPSFSSQKDTEKQPHNSSMAKADPSSNPKKVVGFSWQSKMPLLFAVLAVIVAIMVGLFAVSLKKRKQ